MPWEEWIENFEIYLEARGGTATWSDSRKVALLRHCLGTEGQAQYRAIQDQPAEGENEYAKTITRLRKRFSSEKGLIESRLEFASRKQLPAESFREFVGALQRLAKKCRFPLTAEEAILTQLTVNTSSQAAREKLMSRREGEAFEDSVTMAARAETNVVEAAVFIRPAMEVNQLHRNQANGGMKSHAGGSGPAQRAGDAAVTGMIRRRSSVQQGKRHACVARRSDISQESVARRTSVG